MLLIATNATCRLRRAMSEFEQSGKHVLVLSSSQFDPERKLRPGGADRSLRPNGAFQEAKRERSIITCKRLSADARLRHSAASTKITGGFRDEIAGLCNSICARAYPELRLRSRANRPQHERRRAD